MNKTSDRNTSKASVGEQGASEEPFDARSRFRGNFQFGGDHWQSGKKKFFVGKELFFLGGLIVFVIIVTWGFLSNIEKREKREIARTLVSVLETAHAGIQNQFQNQKYSAEAWAESEQIIGAAETLIALPLRAKNLLVSPAQMKLRKWINPLIKTVGYRGYFIIGRNNINLASLRDENIGVQNLLKSEFLKTIWAGETHTSLPQPSDMPLTDANGETTDHLATMFVATPIKNIAGKVIALLVFRLEPGESFSTIFSESRFGDTGDTYAFDENGLLISNHHAALFDKLRNPGIDLTAGQKSTVSRAQQPLTKMARLATAKQNGLDLNGYRNYLGTMVVGAWMWDEQLGLGFATEIETKEAFQSLERIKFVIILFSIIAIGTLLVMAMVFYKGRKGLALSEQRYSLSQNYAGIGTWDWNIKTGDLLWSNMIGPLFGYEQGGREPSYANFLKAVHSNDRHMVTEAVQSAIDGKTNFDIEHRVMWPDGSVHWVRETGGIERAKDGTPIRMLGVIIDIDERKNSETKLAAHTKELDFQKYAIDEHAIVSIANVLGVIIYANDKFCKISGYARPELMGQNHRIIKSDEHLPEFYEDLWQSISSGRVWQGEIKNAKKNGDSYWVMSTIVPSLNEQGKPFQYVSIHTDITERKTAELAAMTANRAKSDLMANMSHELRTPLNAIIGFSATMKAEIFGPINNKKYEEYLDDIHDSGQHLLSLINDVLDVSAIEAGALHLHEEWVDLARLVEASVRLVRPRAEMGELDVKVVEHSTSQKVFVDERRVKQVLLNLLSNAVKFTPKSGAVMVNWRQNDKGTISLMVEDNGVGMDKGEIAKALSTFGQVDSGLNRQHEGTGLGLPLTVGLMKLHGGTLAVESEKGKGTIITVTFPAFRVE